MNKPFDKTHPYYAETAVSMVEQVVEQKVDSLTVQIKHEQELQVKQTEALTSLAQSFKSLSEFVCNGGLSEVVFGYARSQAVQSILGGLATADGRKSLDARVLGQNAIEIVEAVEKVFNEYGQRLEAKARGETRDPNIVDPEAQVREYYDSENNLISVKMDGEKPSQ